MVGYELDIINYRQVVQVGLEERCKSIKKVDWLIIQEWRWFMVINKIQSV